MRVALKLLHHHGRNVSRQRQVIGVVPLNFNAAAGISVSGTLNPSSSSSSSSFIPFRLVNVKFKSTTTTPPAAAAAANKDEEEEKSKREPIFAKTELKVNKDKPWLMDMGIPSMYPEWKKMFDPSSLVTDVSAGLTVGCVAVPLSLAIAVASGVPPEVGLVTAAVSGIAGGLLGGTTLAITGPAAAISLLVVGAVQEHGLEALPFITLVCGGLQVASGVTRIGVMAKLVPVSVIAGFTTGVGAMILSGQVPKALGLTAPAGLNPIETMGFIAQNASGINFAAATLAIGTSAAMFLLPKVHPKMPSALLAVGGATLATHGLGLDVALIGNIPSGLEAFQFAMPVLPPMDAVPSLSATIFLIYAMTSAESLLSCAALEKMKKTSYQHNPDQELVGQGLANMGAGMFMGMPVTSVIARSSLNVKLNAETRLPALVQAGFVFGSVVFFSDSIATIPMPALSGMLITTGMGMLNPAEFKHCFAVQKLDTIPFLTTIGGMISFGLAEGIGIGCLSAWALNYDYGKLDVKEMELPRKDDPHLEYKEFELPLPGETKTTVAWQLQGPINFASMLEIDNLIHRIEEMKTEEKIIVVGMQDAASEVEFTGAQDLVNRLMEVSEKNPTLQVRIREMEEDEKVIILDCQETTSVEFTGVEEIVNRLLEVQDQNPGTTIQMWNVSEDLDRALNQCDPTEKIARFCSNTSDEKAPFHFPPKEEEVQPKEVPYWYDSPNFRPTDDAK